MCRGFQEEDGLILNTKAFYVGLCMNPLQLGGGQAGGLLPESMTLCYLPRMNASPPEINNSRIPLLTLHRLISSSPPPNYSLDHDDNNVVVYYGSRERVRVRQGARFELYLRDHKLATGVFRKDWDHQWKMDCSGNGSCGYNNDVELVNQVHVCVVAQATHVDLALTAKLELVKNNNYTTTRRRNHHRFILEEIPEETECDVEEDDHGCDSCCSCSSISYQNDTHHDIMITEQQQQQQQQRQDTHMEMEEVVGWAVDVGIWVMCLGFGLLLSRASPKNKTFLRRTTTRITRIL